MKPAQSLFPAYDPSGDRPLEVGVLVLDQTNMLSLASAVDPMRAANRRARRELFHWRFLTPGTGPVGVTAGLAIAAAPVAAAAGLDFLILVAGFGIEEQTTAPLLRQLRRLSRQGCVIAGVDGGGWVLAASGLLDGQAATTHWEDLDRFAAKFPKVQTVRDRYRIGQGVMTTGGASPCIDMMLHLIGRLHGQTLATRVASAFIYDPVHEGAAPQRLVPTASLMRRAPAVARAIALMEARLDAPPSVAELAAALGLSRRSLELRFQTALGQSPHAFGRALRLSEARRLVLDTDQPVQEIALATGFGSPAAFSRAFRDEFGTSARQHRMGRRRSPD